MEKFSIDKAWAQGPSVHVKVVAAPVPVRDLPEPVMTFDPEN